MRNRSNNKEIRYYLLKDSGAFNPPQNGGKLNGMA